MTLGKLIQSETLDLLEWPRLCQHLATFAATKLGAIAACNLQIPATLDETRELLAQTRETYELEMRLPTGLSFEGIHDIGDSLERAGLQGILTGEELLNIAATLSGSRKLRRSIDSSAELPNISLKNLTNLVEDLRTYPEIEQEIYRCIDERGKVADRASPKLAGIREQIKQMRDRIYQVLHSIMQRQSGAIQEQLIVQRGERFVLPVKAPQKDAIPGIVHDASSTGATLYIEPHAVINLNNQMRQLQRSEQTEEEAIRQILSAQVGNVKPDLERLLVIVTTIDLAVAKARYSLWLEANPPHFLGQESTPNPSPIVLRQLRHPLLVWQQKHETGLTVVPIDVIIKPTIRVVAITGPNTGGKTVTLKTLGLAALMAKAGLFIPAKEPVELPWFDLVLADIGDEQSLEQSLSTFSGHIRRISRILAAIQNSSTPLVLLDEVGAGTDPSEGSALAIALLRYLADTTLLTIATTHFGELKALKYEDPRFENASVEFDDNSLQPTYRVLWGIPGRSNAFSIARRLGLISEIVDQAQTYVIGKSGEDVNQVIAALEAQRREQESKAKEANKLLQQTEILHGEVSQKAAELQDRERELKLAQELAIQAAITEAKGEIAKVIRRLQGSNQNAKDAQQATTDLQGITQKYQSVKSQPLPQPGFMPKVGDRIYIIPLGKTIAKVLSDPDDSGELAVQFGQMKLTVNLADIESLTGDKPAVRKKAEVKVNKQEENTPTKTVNSDQEDKTILIRTDKNSLDIRGKHVADAEIEIDRALSKAINIGVLWIIHGKGTGKLRQGVHEFLQQNPLVTKYELASNRDGGSGVTIAYLK